jgi:hypothetical protein
MSIRQLAIRGAAALLVLLGGSSPLLAAGAYGTFKYGPIGGNYSGPDPGLGGNPPPGTSYVGSNVYVWRPSPNFRINPADFNIDPATFNEMLNAIELNLANPNYVAPPLFGPSERSTAPFAYNNGVQPQGDQLTAYANWILRGILQTPLPAQPSDFNGTPEEWAQIARNQMISKGPLSPPGSWVSTPADAPEPEIPSDVVPETEAAGPVTPPSPPSPPQPSAQPPAPPEPKPQTNPLASLPDDFIDACMKMGAPRAECEELARLMQKQDEGKTADQAEDAGKAGKQGTNETPAENEGSAATSGQGTSGAKTGINSQATAAPSGEETSGANNGISSQATAATSGENTSGANNGISSQATAAPSGENTSGANNGISSQATAAPSGENTSGANTGISSQATAATSGEGTSGAGLSGATIAGRSGLVGAAASVAPCLDPRNKKPLMDCVKDGVANFGIGATCAGLQQYPASLSGNFNVGIVCQVVAGFSYCLLSHTAAECIKTSWDGLPTALFCASVGLLHRAAGALCGPVLAAAAEANAALDAWNNVADKEDARQFLQPIFDDVRACNFQQALDGALDLEDPTRTLTPEAKIFNENHPEEWNIYLADLKRWFPNLPRLISQLRSQAAAMKEVNSLVGDATKATDPAERQRLLKAAYDAGAGIIPINCLPKQVRALAPPPAKTASTPPPAASTAACPVQCTYSDGSQPAAISTPGFNATQIKTMGGVQPAGGTGFFCWPYWCKSPGPGALSIPYINFSNNGPSGPNNPVSGQCNPGDGRITLVSAQCKGASTPAPTYTNVNCGYQTPLLAAPQHGVAGTGPPATGQSQVFPVNGTCCPAAWCLNNDGSPASDDPSTALPLPGGQCKPNQTKSTLTAGWNEAMTVGYTPSKITCSSGAPTASASAAPAAPATPPQAATPTADLGPPAQDQAATPMASLGPPPQGQAATQTAGLGPPPQDQAATPMASLGPPPDSPAAPAPASPSSPGTSATPIAPVIPRPLSLPAPQPTASYNSGSNICNPAPVAPPKPANVCNPSTPSTAGNAAQQTAAVPPQKPLSAPTAGVNGVNCNTVNGLTTCTDMSGNSCTSTAGYCTPTAPQPAKTAAAPTPPAPNASPLKIQPQIQTASAGNPGNQTSSTAPTAPAPNAAPLQLKPQTQTASAGNPGNQKTQTASVPVCSAKPPYLPWSGTGSATITVSGGQPCGVGWHDTPGGPGGVTVLDSMSVSSPPAHGSLRPQDQHVIIFTPASGYKGQDSFMLTMQEHNGGRSATLRVKVSVTIQ